MHRIGAVSCDASLRILAGTSSGPEALAGLRSLSSFSVPGTVNCISGMDDKAVFPCLRGDRLAL